MARRRRRLTIDFARLLACDEGLARADRMWRSDGYVPTGARLWRCKDGRYTARVVWRNRAAAVSTVTYTIQGLVLP